MTESVEALPNNGVWYVEIESYGSNGPTISTPQEKKSQLTKKRANFGTFLSKCVLCGLLVNYAGNSISGNNNGSIKSDEFNSLD